MNTPQTIISLILLVISSNALGYANMTCKGQPITWDDAKAHLHISTQSFPRTVSTGNEEELNIETEQDLILSGMHTWNRVGSSDFTFTAGYYDDTNQGFKNGRNEIYRKALGNNGPLAYTETRSLCYWAGYWRTEIIEADIVFNSSLPFTTETSTPVNFENITNFGIVTLHELGHALGLVHETQTVAVLNPYEPNGGVPGSQGNRMLSPFADDVRGLNHLYGNDNLYSELIPLPKKSDCNGGSRNLIVSPSSIKRGKEITMEWGVSNLSTYPAELTVTFLLSIDRVIDPDTDIVIGHRQVVIGQTSTLLFASSKKETLTIPDTIEPGYYYIGYYIDSEQQITETIEANNGQDIWYTVQVL